MKKQQGKLQYFNRTYKHEKGKVESTIMDALLELVENGEYFKMRFDSEVNEFEKAMNILRDVLR